MDILVDLIAVLPGTLSTCGIQWQLLSSTCVSDLQAVYEAVMVVWNEKQDLVDVTLDFPNIICAIQTAS